MEIIKELLNIEFQEEMTITPLNTEHYQILDKISKSHVRGDLAFKISGINGNEEITVVIEFQSKADKTMGFRMFVYSINLAKQIHDKGKQVYEFPKGITIYTTDEIDSEDGVDEVYFKIDDFGIESSDKQVIYNSKQGDLLKVSFPFKNLFKMDLDDITKSSLYVFSAVYLYKYRKNPKLIEGMDVKNIINKINQSVEKYQGRNKEALQKISSDCYLDFLDILDSDKIRFEKELKLMNVLTRTPTDILMQKAELIGERRGERRAERIAEEKLIKAEQKAEEKLIKAEQKAYKEKVNMILNMIKLNQSDENIHFITQIPLDEIAKIREENLLQ